MIHKQIFRGRSRLKQSCKPTNKTVKRYPRELKNRKGAIKKYICLDYKAYSEKFASFTKKYLRSTVTSGTGQKEGCIKFV
ncbi:histone H1-like [Mycetomoellerius zeteki]|uniref:histone H1-like n=1 Tax=Mycetomoellerius zeteki TaxID=64791 RepID=UPI00084E9FC7|nr:PREDICTED: histone H1-like [Trachymyrmex zeteki]